MRSGKFRGLMGTTGMLVTMTAAERSRGRFMRAPDHGADDGGMAEFEAAGDVEVGKPADGIETNLPEPEAKPKKPAAGGSGKPPREAAKPGAGKDKPGAAAADKAAGKGAAADAGADGEGADDEGGEDENEDEDEEEDDKPKPKPKASERIRELNKRLRQEERLRLASDARLDALEKRLQGGNSGRNDADAGKPAPDPSDADKYPLGHLDDRYIEDKLEWLAEQKATGQADAVLQRQQEGERLQQAREAHDALLEKVDDLSTRGSEKYDDFQESVVDAGMRGDWRLDQPTFEAAHEADNGAQILYELSQDKKEAARVAKLSPYAQMKFVMERDAEIGLKAKPRTKPGAGEPPATRTRGANSSARINPATENLDDFEKAWAADAKGS